MTQHKDILTLTVNGRAYAGWEAARVSRGIDRIATDFDLTVSQRWAGQDRPWRIDVFDACTLAIDDVPVLTGYVDEVTPQILPALHSVQVVGRGKTGDLIDCAPDIAGGQFSGYTLAAIARAVCAPFGIAVVDASDGLSANTFADATLQRGETAFTFLERLGRLSGVLLTDDADGDLVLATVGSTRAAGRLVEGDNIGAARASLSGRHRFSIYIVKGQHALGVGGAGSYAGAGGDGEPADAPTVLTQMRAVSHDYGVPRFRPRVMLAESMLTGDGLQRRADWLAQFNFGRATMATVTVAGWRQPDGTLWTPNQIVPVNAPALGVQQDLLVAGVDFLLTPFDGRATKLRVAPVEAFTPDPGEVKLHKTKGRRPGGSVSWTGAGGQ